MGEQANEAEDTLDALLQLADQQQLALALRELSAEQLLAVKEAVTGRRQGAAANAAGTAICSLAILKFGGQPEHSCSDVASLFGDEANRLTRIELALIFALYGPGGKAVSSSSIAAE